LCLRCRCCTRKDRRKGLTVDHLKKSSAWAEASERAFIVVGPGATARNALVISQVVLSIALPLPMITLLHPKWRLMGRSPIAVIIAGLNTFPEIFDLMEARLDSVGDGPIVQSMTTSPGPLKKPDFFVRRARVAGRYSVSVAIPNGMEDDIYVFDTAQEAKDWIENDSDQWLKDKEARGEKLGD
jgi:hypothetical protein